MIYIFRCAHPDALITARVILRIVNSSPKDVVENKTRIGRTEKSEPLLLIKRELNKLVIFAQKARQRWARRQK